MSTADGKCDLLESMTAASVHDATIHRAESLQTSEHIEPPAKLLDYFFRSNKSNINQNAERYRSIPATLGGAYI